MELNLDYLLAASSSGQWFTGLVGVLWRILQIALGLGFVIFVHELGHFLAAKFFGVKCEKFYIGFDVPIRIGPIRFPRTLGKFQWGETEYGIGLIPLGGYVKMLGQDDDPRRAEAEAARIRQANGDTDNVGQLDPRSYPAKPVYARMIIISAGVIMNLIFAVFLGAAAFFYGVPYTPTIVGVVFPGGPAWQAGIQPGDQITQVGFMKKPNEWLYFSDMQEEVMLWGINDKTKKVPVHLRRDNQERTLEILATQRHDPKGMMSMLGMRPMNSTTLAPIPGLMQDEEGVDFHGLRGGDVILAVDGVSLPIDSRFQLPFDVHLLQRLNAKNDQAVELEVERKQDKNATPEKVKVTLPPIPANTLGFLHGPGTISSVAEGSDAAKAGIQVGFQLQSFNGAPIADGLNLYLEVLKHCGKEVTVTLKNPADSTTIDWRWRVPELPQMTRGMGLPAPLGFELCGSGLVYTVDKTLTGTEPDSPAAKAGLQPGDILKQVQVVANEAQRKKLTRFSKQLYEPIVLDQFFDAVYIDDLVQTLPTGTPLKVFVERSGVVQEAMVEVASSQRWHRVGRELALEPLSSIQSTDSVWQALAWGGKETWRRMKMVGNFLRLLISGKIPLKYLGGPGTIFHQASSAAAEGPSKLLLFLVLLSANLAILNSLPIPALDGGHMVFLLTEWVIGRPVDEELQARITMIGVLGLLALMVFVLFNDYNFLMRAR